MVASTSIKSAETPSFDPRQSEVALESFAAFLHSFPLQGEQLYTLLFDRHAEVVQTQKARFAVANLEKIMTATFDISAVSGFDRMSLRDLSRQTGMSMGAIYSCIRKKEDIALMVADIVRLSSDLTRQHAMQASSHWAQIEESIRFHLFASTVLQPWYFFLYFETRSLPEAQQIASTQIERDAITSFKAQIEAGIQAGEFATANVDMIANTIVVMLEDWYLKPWKTQSLTRREQSLQEQENKIIEYHRSLTALVKQLLIPVSD